MGPQLCRYCIYSETAIFAVDNNTISVSNGSRLPVYDTVIYRSAINVWVVCLSTTKSQIKYLTGCLPAVCPPCRIQSLTMINDHYRTV